MGGGPLDQPTKGTSVMNRRKKKRKKELGKGGEEKKKFERKGHEWQLIWGVSATPQRAMTSSGIEVREEEKGLFKKLAAYRGRNYICAKHAQVLLCCGGNHFQRWGLEGWINQLCLLWGLFITKNLSHEILRSPPKKKKPAMFSFSSVLWRANFSQRALVFLGLWPCTSAVSAKPPRTFKLSLMSGLKGKKKNVLPTLTPPLPTPPTLSPFPQHWEHIKPLQCMVGRHGVKCTRKECY